VAPAEDPIPDLSLLMDALDDGVVLLEDGHVIGTNGAFRRLVGVGLERLLGVPFEAMLCDADGRPVHDLAPGDTLRIRDADGALVPISLRRVSDRVWLVVDRARERRLEREVWRLTEQVRRMGGDSPPLSFPNEELFGMIEHEIRTATTVIQGYTRMLLEERVGPVNSTQQSFLTEMRRATDRISSLLDNLLEIASIEGEDGLRMTRKRVGLHEIVQQSLEGARPLLDDRSLRVEVALDAEPDTLRADPERLEQVVMNLLSNAAKFAPAGSRVRVATRLHPHFDGAALSLWVEDEGPGVREEEADRIFRPFVQGSAAADFGGEGVGLGLAICRRIVEAHGGAIEAIACSRGGCFHVTLVAEE
jgi:signal transduction histidine kinase